MEGRGDFVKDFLKDKQTQTTGAGEDTRTPMQRFNDLLLSHKYYMNKEREQFLKDMEKRGKIIKAILKDQVTPMTQSVEEDRPPVQRYSSLCVPHRYNSGKDKRQIQRGFRSMSIPMLKGEAKSEMGSEAAGPAMPMPMGSTLGDDGQNEAMLPAKPKYRYSLEDLKSLNPYRK